MSNLLNVVIDRATSFLGVATYASGPGGENEDIMVNGEPIAPQILAEVFLRIDNSVTVGYICPLVCRRWHNVLSAAGFWIDYMRRRSRTIPPPALRSEPLLNMKKVCLKQPFGRNLIDNPSGEKNFDGWTIRENGGNRIIIENPPLSCASELDNIAVCFATSFGWGKMCYVVDLWKEGIEAAFLDAYRPPITVSEYFTCRTDCAATYVLDVELVPDGQETCISTERPVMTRRDRFGRPVMVRRQRPEGDATTNFSITRVRNMEQWSSGEWQYVEHTFKNYPVGIRFVVFEHSGKDLQFWAGHYGSKMAKASVVVNCANDRRMKSATVKTSTVENESSKEGES
uniref:FBA domain-containing protein n=1 Tax=Parascaris univalens TaxID=6257 RepID=A0A915BNK9_PARUN